MQTLSSIALVASLALLSLASTACTRMLAPPRSFAELGDGDYDYRATTPQGVVVAARSEPNDAHAGTEFWARAIDLRLKKDGYALAGQSKVVTDRGLEGIEMRFARGDEGRTYRYVVAVFAKAKRVYVVEAAGDQEDFDPAQGDVDRAIRSLRD